MTISINSLVPAFHTCVPSWWLQGDAGSDNKHTHTKLQRIYAINVIIIIIAIIISVFVTVNDCYCVLKLLLVVLHPACINFTLNVCSLVSCWPNPLSPDQLRSTYATFPMLNVPQILQTSPFCRQIKSTKDLEPWDTVTLLPPTRQILKKPAK